MFFKKSVPVFLLVFILIEGSTAASFENVLRQLTNFWKDHKWPNNNVPFTISSQFTQTQKNKIIAAITKINSKACVILRHRENESDYLEFKVSCMN